MSKKTKDALVVGFALFAVFFGAGNLIFPPLVGVVSGSGWPAAIMGLMLSGILLPIATIVAVDNMGGRFEQLCRPVSGWFCSAYMVFFVIFIGKQIYCHCNEYEITGNIFYPAVKLFHEHTTAIVIMNRRAEESTMFKSILWP